VRAPLMYQQRDRVRYSRARGYQAVDLIYKGGDLSMLVLLPDRKDGLRDLEKTLSAQMLHDCVAKMEIREVKLFLPRFKINWGTVDMRDHLTALGMPLAFTRFKADFSGINGYEPPAEESLFLSAVFHKAFVEVYEEGTEAAAASAVVFGRVGAPFTLLSRRRFPSSELTIHSCSPSAIGRAARSCFSDAWPILERLRLLALHQSNGNHILD
jgi:serine protease inhibitor